MKKETKTIVLYNLKDKSNYVNTLQPPITTEILRKMVSIK